VAPVRRPAWASSSTNQGGGGATTPKTRAATRFGSGPPESSLDQAIVPGRCSGFLGPGPAETAPGFRGPFALPNLQLKNANPGRIPAPGPNDSATLKVGKRFRNTRASGRQGSPTWCRTKRGPMLNLCARAGRPSQKAATSPAPCGGKDARAGPPLQKTRLLFCRHRWEPIRAGIASPAAKSKADVPSTATAPPSRHEPSSRLTRGTNFPAISPSLNPSVF